MIVILWSRMGTPLPDSMRKPNSEHYLSGTEWEYEDAVNSPRLPRPEVLVYRRIEQPKVELGDPELADKLTQFQRVRAFFAQLRSLNRGVNEYETPSNFKTLLSQNLQDVVWRRLQASGINRRPPPTSDRPPAICFADRPSAQYVERPELSEPLVDFLCKGEALRKTAVIAGIRGLGGIGKTQLASAIAWDPRIHETFPDGILWATVGERPITILILILLIRQLNDVDFVTDSLAIAVTRFRQLTHNKRLLLVLDDVWRASHIEQLLPTAQDARVLITTRRAEVAEHVGALSFEMDLMSIEQARELVKRRSGSLPSPEQDTDFSALARAVGFLPPLDLLAIQIRRIKSWPALRHRLEAALQKLTQLGDQDHLPANQRPLRACFDLSFEFLWEADQSAAMAYLQLSVFKEDVVVTAPMAKLLWRVSDDNAEVLLDWFCDESLLLTDRSNRLTLDKSTTPSGKRYRLHDLMRDFAAQRSTEPHPRGLGRSFQDLHASLLDAYSFALDYDALRKMPRDGYIHQHLRWHLEQAERPETIHEMLGLEGPSSQNAWYDIVNDVGLPHVFYADVAEALRLVRAAGSSQSVKDWPTVVAREVRYHIMLASVSTQARALSPVLVGHLISSGLWQHADVVWYVRQVTNPIDRVYCAAVLSPVVLANTVDAIWEIAFINTALVPEHIGKIEFRLVTQYVPPQWWAWVVKLATKIDDEGRRIRTLLSIAPSMPAEYVDVVLDEELPPSERLELLVCILARTDLRDKEHIAREAWELAEFVVDVGGQVQHVQAAIMKVLNPHVSKHMVQSFVSGCRKIEYAYSRALLLLQSLNAVPNAHRPLVTEAAIEAMWQIGSPVYRRGIAKSLLPLLSQEAAKGHAERLLAEARSHRSPEAQIEAVADLVNAIGVHLIYEVIERLGTISSASVWASVAKALAVADEPQIQAELYKLLERYPSAGRFDLLLIVAPHARPPLSEQIDNELFREASAEDLLHRVGEVIEAFSSTCNVLRKRALADAWMRQVRTDLGKVPEAQINNV